MSNVDAMTSPLHGALHVGHLFGALVHQQAHEVHLGVVRRDGGLAISLRMVVLPALGGLTMRPRWPLPMGADQVDDARP